MAIDIPGGCYRQPTESEGVADSGDATYNYVLKGGHAALKDLSDSLTQGTVVVDGWLARSWTLQRGNGNTGTLTITCARDAGTEGEGAAATTAPIKDVWKINNVRIDVSMMKYCGVTPGGPLRNVVERWLRETDSETAAAGNYRENGEVVDVATTYPPSAELIAKMMKGVESVMRFYPAVTRVRTYAAPPPDCLDDVGYTGSPPTPADAGWVKKPGSLANKLSAYSWLKVQDDCDEAADGNWTRTECWWGIHNRDGGWDADLYGPNRWPMPYIVGGGNNGGGNT